RAVATSAHGPDRKFPTITLGGAKPIECTTPSRASTCSPTRPARASRSSWSVTSSWTTGAGCGSRRAIAWVSLNWRPKEESTTWAPCSWASLATLNAMELSISTPVTRSFFPSSRPICLALSVLVLAGVGSVPHAEAAVDREDRAADVSRFRRSQVGHRLGDLFGLPEPGRRDTGQVLLLGGLRQLGGHRGLDEARGDHGSGDTPCAQLTRDGSGHPDQPGLGGSVVDLAR